MDGSRMSRRAHCVTGAPAPGHLRALPGQRSGWGGSAPDEWRAQCATCRPLSRPRAHRHPPFHTRVPSAMVESCIPRGIGDEWLGAVHGRRSGPAVLFRGPTQPGAGMGRVPKRSRPLTVHAYICTDTHIYITASRRGARTGRCRVEPSTTPGRTRGLPPIRLCQSRRTLRCATVVCRP